MRRQNLESKVKNCPNPHVRAPFKSVGETILAETLERLKIRYTYEKQVLVEDQREGDDEKARLWYPDFYLDDLNIVVEYVGRPNDKNYMEGIQRKKETYEKMGFKVILVDGAEIFENGKRRRDFEKELRESIEEAYYGGKSSKLVRGRLETNISQDYTYRSNVAA